ncbi:MAG: FkbM family methyltransferase [Acidobacteriia bacterium]|nr:FkbM family methyltransferase [Terriglobia bacterium]
MRLKKYVRYCLLLLTIAGVAAWLTLIYRPAPIWTAYIAGRWWLFTATRRNPLCKGAAAPSIQRYYEMIKARKDSEKVSLLERDSEGRTKWHLDLGDFWIPNGTPADFLTAVVGEQMANTYGYSEREGAIVLDCGANIGTFTKWAVRHGAGTVVAIEPAPENLECLRRNFADEIRAGKVVIFEGGVWDRNDKLFLTSDAGNPGADRIVQSPRAAEAGTWVPLTTIDELVSKLKLQRVDFIKMDIEGSEQKALTGGAKTIRSWRPRIAVATEHTSDLLNNSMEVIRIVRSFNPGYQYRCGYCGVVQSARWGGRVLTPVSLVFE